MRLTSGNRGIISFEIITSSHHQEIWISIPYFVGFEYVRSQSQTLFAKISPL